MVLRFPTWVFEYFLSQIERSKFWVCETTLWAQGVGAGAGPLLKKSLAGIMSNVTRTGCYHFATELGSTSWNGVA
jgi:hypothetical protein